MEPGEVGQDDAVADMVQRGGWVVDMVRRWRERLYTATRGPAVRWEMVNGVFDEMDEFLGDKKP